MPRTHSPLYDELVEKTDNIQYINPKALGDKLGGNLPYTELVDLLRETNDAQFGIVSRAYDSETSKEWVRDATNASQLKGRLSHDNSAIEVNNTLLRCLSRLRPIDFAIEKKFKLVAEEEKKQVKPQYPVQEEEINDQKRIITQKCTNKIEKVHDAIRRQFSDLSYEVLTIAKDRDKTEPQKLKEIKKAEEEFNTFLVEQLHEANLTKGCETREDAEKLLFHYRNLSSVLEPTRTLITETYDDEAHVFQRETQYPVTQKTPVQLDSIDELQHIVPHPSDDQKSAHTVRNVATQEADALFADLIKKNDRALPAQARKTHLAGAKNAFIVKNELVHIASLEVHESILKGTYELDTLQAVEDTLWLARTGSPVYVGKGEDSDAIQIHTHENLEQIRSTTKEKMGLQEDATLDLLVTTLNTYSPLENQDTIISHVKAATRDAKTNSDNCSIASTNAEGTIHFLDIAPDVANPPKGIAPLQKATRVESVATVVLAARQMPTNKLSVVHCASGQDRTGTAVEKATQMWMETWYGEKKLNPHSIQSTRARGGNAAEITSHHVNGSPGMKKESIANNFFGKQQTFEADATREFYRSSANTNKKNKVGNVDFLKKQSDAALKEYYLNYNAFKAIWGPLRYKVPPSSPLWDVVEKAAKIQENVDKIVKGHPEKLNPKSLADLNQVLSAATKGLRDPTNPKNIKELEGLSHHVTGKKSLAWKALGVGLLAFSAALVVLGAAAAFHTGGLSLLVSAIGVKTALVGAGLIAGTGIAGAGFFSKGREKGLAKSVNSLKSSLRDLKDPEIKKLRETIPAEPEPDDSDEDLSHSK